MAHLWDPRAESSKHKEHKEHEGSTKTPRLLSWLRGPWVSSSVEATLRRRVFMARGREGDGVDLALLGLFKLVDACPKELEFGFEDLLFPV